MVIALNILANPECEGKSPTHPPIESVALALGVRPIENHREQKFLLLALNWVLRIPAPLGVVVTVAKKFDQPLKLSLVVANVCPRAVLLTKIANASAD